jgi:hypothetical protein
MDFVFCKFLEIWSDERGTGDVVIGAASTYHKWRWVWVSEEWGCGREGGGVTGALKETSLSEVI